MEIKYTEKKEFTQQQVQELFLSVGWVSGQYPSRLYKALMNSSTVITAWDEDKLVGLVRALDDSELVAYLHYVLVNPAYHGQGIAGTMIEMIKEKYKDYLYIEGMPENRKMLHFIRSMGFKLWKMVWQCRFAIMQIKFKIDLLECQLAKGAYKAWKS